MNDRQLKACQDGVEFNHKDQGKETGREWKEAEGGRESDDTIKIR